MARAAALLAALSAIVAPIPPASASDPWAALRRPLQIPRIAPGAPCPVTPAQVVQGNRVLGAGPVYPTGAQLPTLPFNYPPQPSQVGWYGSRWSGQKVLWLGRPSYRKPVLIRGRQLDGRHQLRFGNGLNPAFEMRLRSVGGFSPGGWQNRPSYTRLRAPGCYAWQVDGTTFSRVIVFRAELFT